jgi:hypothetical protein
LGEAGFDPHGGETGPEAHRRHANRLDCDPLDIRMPGDIMDVYGGKPSYRPNKPYACFRLHR